MDSLSATARFVGLDPRAFFAALPAPAGLADATLALWGGADAAAVADVRDMVRREIRAAVDDLLEDRAVAAAAEALPIGEGDRVVVLGDSISAEAGSWADLLAEVLRRVRPGSSMLNWSVAGRTTAETVGALAPVVAHRPDWVLTMVGTNDVRRHGAGEGVRMASSTGIADARAALRQRLTAETDARIITITPPPIDPAAVPANRLSGIWWEVDDIEDAVAAALADDPKAVDVHGTVVSAPGFWVADGIHPTAAGQREILRAVLAGVAARAA